MIKNLLYSIFLHLLLFIVIYFSFSNLKEIEEKEVVVTIVQEPTPKPVKPVVEEKIVEEKQPEIKKEIPKKIEPPKPEPQKKNEKILPKVEPKKEPVKKEIPKKEERPVVTKATPDAKKEPPKEKAPEKKVEKPITEKLDKILDKIIDKPSETPPKKVEEKIEAKPVVENPAPKAEAVTEPQTLENINLSPREKFNIQSQLRRCYKKAVDENKPQIKINVTIIAQLNQNGDINSNLENIIDQNRYNNPQEINYKMAIDNVRKAINMCSPLRNLPVDKYDIWKEVSLKFDEDSLN